MSSQAAGIGRSRRRRIGAAVAVLAAAACGGDGGDPAGLVAPGPQEPVVAITAPEEGAVFQEGFPIVFRGAAEDPQEGELAGQALVWSSSRDGELGRGATLTRDRLTAGTHTITLTATDGRGFSGFASRSIIVAANQRPAPEIEAPADGDVVDRGAPVEFRGRATDPEDGALTGEALTWTSNEDGRLGTGASFSRSDLSLGTHLITLAAEDRLGARAVTTVRLTVEPPNDPPVVSIEAPADGAVVDEDQEVVFRGTATDAEDASLPDAALVWTSDLDGELGTGPETARTFLTPGTHAITFAATDSRGETGSASIALTVQAVGPPNAAPTVSIDRPLDLTIAFEGDPVDFAGGGDDAEDGPLSGAALVWTSDLDGELGTGTGFTRSDLSLGRHTVTLTGTDTRGARASESVSLTINVVPRPGFQITVRFTETSVPSAAQIQAMEDAARRWEALITGDLADWEVTTGGPITCGGASAPALNEIVDDVLIFADFGPIDGPGGILGQAGPCWLRSGGGLPFLGGMRFDTADLANLEAQGTLGDVILHEVAHVLGVGTLWSSFGFLVDPSSTSGPIVDTHFVGPEAIAAFDAVGGTAYAAGEKVPVENDNTQFGAGSLNGHWRELVFTNELMSPRIQGAGNPLSLVTVESLEDLGYLVEPAGADPYALGFPLLAGPIGGVSLEGDIWDGPIRVAETPGRLHLP